MTSPQSVARLPSTSPCSHSGRVCFSGSDMTTSARVYSFHACRNPYTPDATSPGASSGKVIRKKAPVRDRPSTIAASSSSIGMPLTNPRSIQMVKGRMAAT
ncbi:hypothetical protein U6N30_32615 [Blastococcus brunescens]|uniref:Uncharacterized protein n=1 Tax=Blastococcus brunescens TaxID=1564165 RepID=A0ABZ1B0B5_9ACTN|nr:hypothetical protein [Blastococcus sp. BMG 8361]WRL64239.1 hypothetical protein U6N30_32615 [Blastococcus sp. BMG 8361]